MSWLRFIISAVLMLGGLAAFLIGTFGIYKFKFVLNRMHSAAILDTMGLLLVIISLAVARGFDGNTIKMFLIVLFLWLTSPISSHLIAKMEFFTDKSLNKEITNNLDDVKGGEDNELRDL